MTGNELPNPGEKRVMESPEPVEKRPRTDGPASIAPPKVAPKRMPTSFGVRVEFSKKVPRASKAGDDTSDAEIGRAPEMVKTYCQHDVSLPADYPVEYNFKDLALGDDHQPAKEYEFELDAFQREAVKCVEKNESVLVAAHTSAGKTVVAEYALAVSLRGKSRVIYTSPIKALSNQKFRELEAEFSDVGLMTGDVTINKNASCLVMTTEILRSMLYRGSEIVREVSWIVFDEVHYMRDKERGVVWEETIILAPQNARFVFLSATIPNAREFSEWIAHLKNQPCHTIYTDTRPVPLQHYLFPSGGEGLHLIVDDKGEFRMDAFERAISEIGSNKGDSGGGASGPNRRRNSRAGSGAPGKSDCYKVVKMIMERNFYPVIIFSFSRRDCETLAVQMAKLDFNSDEEREFVEKVFENAMASLNEEDQDLPQITAILPLLKRGIGIHHSGLLPIVKEVVELLFQEGLIKALFATETFSMGLNMPARTVLFTTLRKYDGEKFRHVLGGEYIQMSGRAGRRGIDERGIAIMMCDEKLEPAAAKSIMSGSSEPLKSTFRLGYNMLLNLLRAEEADPEFVIARSLAQFQADRALPANEATLVALEQEREEIVLGEDGGSDLEERDIRAFFKLRDVAEKLRKEVRDAVHAPSNILPFLQPGRLVRVRDGKFGDDYGWGAIVNFTRRSNAGGKKLEEERYSVDVLLRCVAGSSNGARPRPFRAVSGKEGGEEWVVVPTSFKHLDGISALRVYKPEDLRPLENRASVGKSIIEVLRRFKDGPSLLDPFSDLGITDESFAVLLRKVEAVEEAMTASPVSKSADLKKLTKQWRAKSLVSDKIATVKRELKIARGIILKDELKRMKRVLRRLGFTTPEGVVEIKGRVACEVNTADELVLTELLLGGSLNDLSPEVLVAVCSCFVLDEGKKDDKLQLKKELQVALDALQAVCTRVATVTKESGIPIDIEAYVDSFSPNAMNVVYTWCMGKSFTEVCKLSDLFEGSVVRCFRRLEELLRQLIAAAKSIGNAELEQKFEAGSAKLRRGIAFQSSLYI